jgi:FkbM family methyltransferase
MMNTLRSLNFVARHPLNRSAPLQAVGRVLAWQIATRLQHDPVAVPFVEQTRLLVRRGMAGATGNVYCGLHEFEDMGFVLHALRPDDLFVDVGANIGSYTVLAAGAVGSRCIAFEPAPQAYAALRDNLRLNDLVARVDARNEIVAARLGQLALTTGLDTTNHVLAAAELEGSHGGFAAVAATTLDSALEGLGPVIIKIDVEGFETEVLAGADSTLRNPTLIAVLIELNGSGARYGFDEHALHERFLTHGFTPARYDPLRRDLTDVGGGPGTSGNTLYVRDIDEARRRVASARRYSIRGVLL